MSTIIMKKIRFGWLIAALLLAGLAIAALINTSGSGGGAEGHGDEHGHDEAKGHDDEHAHDETKGHDEAKGHGDEHGHEEAKGHDEGRLNIPAASLASAGITVEKAGPRQLASVAVMPGEVKIKHDKRVHIVPRLAGVATVIPKGLGDTVKKGDVLLVVDSRELADLKGAFLNAQERHALAVTNFERETGLWAQKISAEQDYLNARKDKAEADIALRTAKQSLQAIGVSLAELNSPAFFAGPNLTRFDVKAPFDGVIITRHVAFGESLAADAEVFELADLSEMEAEVTIYAADLARLKVGMPVKVKALNSELSAEGVVAFIGSTLAEDTRAAIAHVEFPNPGQRWREGLFVEASIVLAQTDVPVAVHQDAIQNVGDGQVVFAQYGDAFKARPVQLGRRDGEWVEIVSGLPAGQAYASRNSFVLKAELGKASASHDH